MAAERSRIADLVPDPGVEMMSIPSTVAAEALLAPAETADLLIIAPTDSVASSTLLGSVVAQCIRHAGCPVLVVRIL